MKSHTPTSQVNSNKSQLNSHSSQVNAPVDSQVVASAQYTSSASSFSSFTVLLGTALVKLTSPIGNVYDFCALLDSGSQLSFISERAAQLIGAPRNILGISTTASKTKGLVNLDLASLSDHKIVTQYSFHILNRISADLPRSQVSQEVWQLTRPYILVLIGPALYPLLLTQRNYSLGPNCPHMIGTLLGYVDIGNAPCDISFLPASHLVALHSACESSDLYSVIQRFWTQDPILFSQVYRKRTL